MIEYERARYSKALCQEMLPLLKANWRESASYEEGIEADPDFERYRKLDAAGMILCITAREAGRLVGYVVYVITHSSHHQTIVCGLGDAIYTDPDHRGVGNELLKLAENRMRAAGVKRLGWSVEEGSRIHRLLVETGFYPDEIVMEKRLA
jgi:GNAT superfamily N-acetyltransferase